jgi:ankyrin repeat protein
LLSQNGWTPLHCAAKAGYLEVVKLLIESGACPKYETIENKMPISLAAGEGHLDVLGYLIQQDRDTESLLDDQKVRLL